MSPSLVIHLRVDAKPCTVAVRMGHDCSYESLELLLPLLALNHGLRGATGRCDVAAGQ
ncbi:hypothetical protein [Cryobacterium sp. Hb1]|uniref:hypothetical protein n=1 Tax=Cryobacterium sp. Hb1 TaxID=1259147 RepID=UPI00141A9146|nr:hypothetical protein [Cryobacterium sp. Hb1]